MTSVGVAITSEGVVLPLWAWFYLCRRVFTSLCVDTTSVGVVLPL